MKKPLGVGLCILTGMVLPGCVTINIYFPAAAAEKAADKIIEEVWQLKKPGEEEQEGQGADKPRRPEPEATEPAVRPQHPPQPQQ
jgi:hypothetical protein